MATEIQLFVKEALSKGIKRPEIREKLLAAGWQTDEVDTALDAYADVAFVIPVPKRKPYLSAREAFMYLVMFLTLYISSFSFGSLIFDFLNRWLPDVALNYNYVDAYSDSIRSATASLIVTFPVFLYVSWILERAMRRDPTKRGSKVRKWLTYLTLFIAAGVIIGDLITLVTSLLGGLELTLRFMLKVLTVLVIAGTIFGYYLRDLRKEEKE